MFSDDALDSARDGLWISVPVHLDIVIDCHSAETGAPKRSITHANRCAFLVNLDNQANLLGEGSVCGKRER